MTVMYILGRTELALRRGDRQFYRAILLSASSNRDSTTPLNGLLGTEKFKESEPKRIF
jgi:hypothetical protein